MLCILYANKFSMTQIRNTEIKLQRSPLTVTPSGHGKSVTVTRGSLVTNQSFGTCQKCHCKRSVTVNSVTVSGEICTGSFEKQNSHRFCFCCPCPVHLKFDEYFTIFLCPLKGAMSGATAARERPLRPATSSTTRRGGPGGPTGCPSGSIPNPSGTATGPSDSATTRSARSCFGDHHVSDFSRPRDQ